MFVDTMKYAKERLVFEEIQKALKGKESQKQIEKETKDTDDSMCIKGKSEKNDNHNNKGQIHTQTK